MEWNEKVAIVKRDRGEEAIQPHLWGGGAILGMKGIGGETAT
jgi:hypothetical protein